MGSIPVAGAKQRRYRLGDAVFVSFVDRIEPLVLQSKRIDLRLVISQFSHTLGANGVQIPVSILTFLLTSLFSCRARRQEGR